MYAQEHGIIQRSILSFLDIPVVLLDSIDYSWRECDGIHEYNIYSFTYPDPSNPNCSSLVANLTLPSGQPNIVFSKWVWDQAYQLLPIKLFEVEYAGAAPWNKSNYECPNGQKYYRGVRGGCERLRGSKSKRIELEAATGELRGDRLLHIRINNLFQYNYEYT